LWEQVMTTDELRGPHWLLSYEAGIKNWLPSLGGGDHIKAEPFFAALRIAGVQFYDETILKIALPPSPPFVSGGGGGPYYPDA
jgi:hypothetical protein